MCFGNLHGLIRGLNTNFSVLFFNPSIFWEEFIWRRHASSHLFTSIKCTRYNLKMGESLLLVVVAWCKDNVLVYCCGLLAVLTSR
jgi:hypothetical protein